jgi:hypothetical protein
MADGLETRDETQNANTPPRVNAEEEQTSAVGAVRLIRLRRADGCKQGSDGHDRLTSDLARAPHARHGALAEWTCHASTPGGSQLTKDAKLD